MAEDTLIAWTDHTFNPWMGCTKVSEGCRHCYAETLTVNRMGLHLWGPDARRQVTKTPWQHVNEWQRSAAKGHAGNYGHALVGEVTPTAAPDGSTDRPTFTPHLVFTGSLMDWAEARPDLNPVRERMWATIRASRHLWFQMLTKRPENIAHCLPPDWGPHGYDNVWLGTTIEDNRVADRARHLTAVPARVHFISYEPAIGPLDQVDLDGVEWVIFGGESGPGYRKHDEGWARDMRDRCVARGTAYFHKQASAMRTETNPWLVEPDGSKWAWKQYPGKFDPPVRIE
jgi:protein gp37